MKTKLLLAAVTALALAPAALAAARPWPTMGGSSARQNARLSTDVRHPSVVWRRWGAMSGTGKVIEHGVTVADGRVYGVTMAGVHFAFRASDGKALWRRYYGRLFASVHTYSRGFLYVNARQPGRLYKMRADTGELVWKRWLLRTRTGQSEGAPLVVDGRVYVTATRGPGAYLVAYNARTGRRLWRRRLCVTSFQGPTWTGRRVIVGDYCGIVRAYTPRGRRVWARNLIGATYASTAYRRGSVYASTKLGYLYRLSSRTGRVRWVSRTGTGEGFGECAVTGRRVYSTNLDGTVRAFRATSGRLVWQRRFDDRVYGAAVATRGRVWVALHDQKRIVALSAGTGGTRWGWGSGRYDPAAAQGRTVFLVGHVSVAAVREGA
jgi:outer membrane protein assembly factor BamB